MNETTYDLARSAVERALDRRTRHWRDEYDTMSAVEVCRQRRQATIEDVTYALVDHFDHLDKATFETVTQLIVDNSYMAWMGFDALNTSTTTAWGRWMARWW